MPEIIKCSSCGKALKLDERLIGKKVRCPACKTVFTAGGGIASIKQALAINPGDNEELYRELGNVFLDFNMYQEAVDAYKEAAIVDDYDEVAYEGLSIAYEKMGMKKESMDARARYDWIMGGDSE